MPHVTLAARHGGLSLDPESPLWMTQSQRDDVLSLIAAPLLLPSTSHVVLVCHLPPPLWADCHKLVSEIKAQIASQPSSHPSIPSSPIPTISLVGRTMFETDSIPDSWIPILSQADAVWVPSPYAQQIFSSALSHPSIEYLPETYDKTLFRPTPLPPPPSSTTASSSPFTFLMIARYTLRKNILPTIRAYFHAFPAPPPFLVNLHLHTSLPPSLPTLDELIQAAIASDPVLQARFSLSTLPPITVTSPPLSPHDVTDLYARASVVVLASHGEGWGRPLMEGCACGRPVLGVNFSGPPSFLASPDHGILLPVDLDNLLPFNSVVPPPTPYDTHKWAPVSQHDLSQAMALMASPSYRSQLESQSSSCASDMASSFSFLPIALQYLHHILHLPSPSP